MLDLTLFKERLNIKADATLQEQVSEDLERQTVSFTVLKIRFIHQDILNDPLSSIWF